MNTYDTQSWRKTDLGNKGTTIDMVASDLQFEKKLAKLAGVKERRKRIPQKDKIKVTDEDIEAVFGPILRAYDDAMKDIAMEEDE